MMTDNAHVSTVPPAPAHAPASASVPASVSAPVPMIHNPILPGFNPDPCIFRDESRYHIAVSTFTWVPGVRVYASDDLVSWHYETSVLATPRLADFAGRPDNMGIWAPMMTWHRGRYYLIYTDVATTQRPFADAANYIITAEDIHGPWSDPVYVNGSGFDPSLFFDDDGSMYVVNELWDYRVTTHNKSAGVVLQRVDARTFEPIGEPRRIFDGTDAAKTEAPHIVRHDGWYYLITAEGGTGDGHQVTVCRSRGVWGPYEVDPETPVLTSKDDPTLALQRAGHGSLVATPDGEWYMAHLCTRPLDGGHAVLGRETALQRVTWTDDGWLRLAQGGRHPAVDVPAPRAYRAEVCGVGAGMRDEGSAADAGVCGAVSRDSAASAPVAVGSDVIADAPAADSSANSFEDRFRGPGLDFSRWSTLRELPGAWLHVGGEPDAAAGLTIAPGASPQSAFGQHMVATRQTDFSFTAAVRLDYTPRTYLDMAGMLLYLDARHYLFLAVTRDERLDGTGGPIIARLMENRDGAFSILADTELTCAADAARAGAAGERVAHALAVDVDRTEASFRVNGRLLASGVDVTFLSGGFTGDFIALTNVGMNRRGDAVTACDSITSAVFRDFSYRAR